MPSGFPLVSPIRYRSWCRIYSHGWSLKHNTGISHTYVLLIPAFSKNSRLFTFTSTTQLTAILLSRLFEEFGESLIASSLKGNWLLFLSLFPTVGTFPAAICTLLAKVPLSLSELSAPSSNLRCILPLSFLSSHKSDLSDLTTVPPSLSSFPETIHFCIIFLSLISLFELSSTRAICLIFDF